MDVMIRDNSKPSPANYIAFKNGVYNLETDELYKFKESPEYNEMIRLYKDKIYPDYQQNLDISKSEEIESTSSYGNY